MMKTFMARTARLARITRLAFLAFATSFSVLFVACSLAGPGSTEITDDPVSITDMGSYYAVTLDFSTGRSHKEIGTFYGNAIKAKVPNIEYLFDSYIAQTFYEMAGNNPTVALQAYQAVVQNNVANVKPQIPQEYRDEIDGMSVLCSTGTTDGFNDGKLSINELYAVNLILDVTKSLSCSAFSAFGDASATGHTVTGRVLDWGAGSQYQLNKIHAVVTIKNGPKSIALIGYLGYMAGLSVVNDDGLFAAILESSKESYTTAGKHSYSMDLRAAMEDCSTMDDVASRLLTPAYVSGHLVFLSDANSSTVLENDLSTTRTVRKAGDALLSGASWYASDSTLGANSIATVNAFMLAGKFDRFTVRPGNVNRWATLRSRAETAFGDGPLDAADVRAIMTAYTGSVPAGQNLGDVYNDTTQQIMIFEPATMSLSVFFALRDGQRPATPTFNTIPLSF